MGKGYLRFKQKLNKVLLAVSLVELLPLLSCHAEETSMLAEVF